MTRRSLLQGIANNLLSSFVSRNNNVDGYWGLGMLHLYCKRIAQSDISLALAPASLDVEIELVAGMARKYATELHRLMRKHGVPEGWLSTASIEIEFEVQERPFSLQDDPPYLCQVRLRTDLGRIYQGRVAGYCRPHDPNRELKSARMNA